ncbi:MAG TPA: thioredoxin family protein [Candidatus Nitrosopolaris sp.]|nr:thioredoxin family protein [Candidatus Nitrosopolaris sp.]
MALTESRDLSLGTPCPDFRLRSVDGKSVARDDFRAKPALVVLFICNHCPYVQAVEERIVQLRRDYGPRGVQLVGICSNDPTDYPDDRPERLLQRWREKDYGFPYLLDETQDVARAFNAVCTPDIYVFDADRRLAYHGRIDDNWQQPTKVKRRELAAALDALLAGRAPAREQQASIGCSIKWRKA